jgi:hypothetical protein
MAREYAEGIEAVFLETSARDAKNVHELFEEISTFCDLCWV